MRTSLIIAGALLLALVVGAWLGLRVSASLERGRGRARNARGKRGERDAERLLEARGYRICARQQRMSYEITVDGARTQVSLVADFVVERAGEELIAEVKTGAGALPSHPDTRRQLLEYQLAVGARRVLLVDPEAARIRELAFPLAATQIQRASPWPALIFVLTLMAAACFWWLHARHAVGQPSVHTKSASSST